MNDEVREWLGLTKADFVFYASLCLAIGSFWITSAPAAVGASVLAIALAAGAAVVGARPQENLKPVTNKTKRVAFLAGVALVCIVAVVRLVRLLV